MVNVICSATAFEADGLGMTGGSPDATPVNTKGV